MCSRLSCFALRGACVSCYFRVRLPYLPLTQPLTLFQRAVPRPARLDFFFLNRSEICLQISTKIGPIRGRGEHYGAPGPALSPPAGDAVPPHFVATPHLRDVARRDPGSGKIKHVFFVFFCRRTMFLINFCCSRKLRSFHPTAILCTRAK